MGDTLSITSGSSYGRRSDSKITFDLKEFRGLVLECQTLVNQLIEQTNHMHGCVVAQHEFISSFVQRTQNERGGPANQRSTDDDSYGDVDESVPPGNGNIESASTDLMAFIQNSSYHCAEDLKRQILGLDNFVRSKVYRHLPSKLIEDVRTVPKKYDIAHSNAYTERMSNQVKTSPSGATPQACGWEQLVDKASQTDVDGDILPRATLQNNLRKETNKNRNLEDEINLLKAKYVSVEETVRNRDEGLKRKDKEISDKNNEIKKLKKKLEEERYPHSRGYTGWFAGPPPPRRKASAQLYCQRQSDLLVSVTMELSKLLTDKFMMQNTDLNLIKYEGGSAVQEGLPIIVLCINASRLGTDVTNAVAGLRLNQYVAVVILHHKDRHALPNQTSDRVLTAPEYKSLGGIYDMAFLSGKGIYQCDMNTTAVTNLVSFIDKFHAR